MDRPQVWRTGLEAHRPSASMSRMHVVTDTERWSAPDDGRALSTWIADRASASDRHLPPIVAVGRTADGHLAVDVLRPAGVPLAEALDVLGVPTTGVAVTLTLPLLELVRSGSSGALVLGDAQLDDVLVDDAGAVVFCDRPPGAVRVVATPASDTTAVPGDAPPGAVRVVATPASDTTAVPGDALPGAVRGAAPGVRPQARPPRSQARQLHASRPTPARHTAERTADVHPAARTLLLATRLVWERVDPREPVRPDVDAALSLALDTDAAPDALDAAIVVVRAAAAPRPVRWDPPPTDVLAFVPAPGPEPAVTALDAAVRALVRDLVDHGIPLGGGRRLPVGQAFVGLVVAVGIVATTLLTVRS